MIPTTNIKPSTRVNLVEGVDLALYELLSKRSISNKGGKIHIMSTKWIDISYHQNVITDAQWKSMKAKKVEGVVIRLGYRGYGSGMIKVDERFTYNLNKAKAYGFLVSVYFFSQAINASEGIAEANLVASKINIRNVKRVFCDTELADKGSGRADMISNANRTAAVKAFCDRIAALGGKPGIYASSSWIQTKLIPAQLLGYKYWVADYRGSCAWKTNVIMWQYSNKNPLGILGFNELDTNECYEDFNAKPVTPVTPVVPPKKEDTDVIIPTKPETPKEPTGSEIGAKVILKNKYLYASSTISTGFLKINSTYYVYDGKEINGRYRVTNIKEHCNGGLMYVSGWANKNDVLGIESTPSAPTKKEVTAGQKVILRGKKLYSASRGDLGIMKVNFTCYIFDGKEFNGRYRVTQSLNWVNKDINKVAGWVDIADI